jgi:hypothetical protein
MLSATAVIDQRSDLYSVGCVALWMLTAKYMPRGQHDVGVRRAAAAEDFRADAALAEAGVPGELARVVLACIEDDPAQRPASAAVLRESLTSGNAGGRWTGDDARAWWRSRMSE